MCPVYVCVGELIRIAKAKVDMRLGCEVKDGVDFVLAKNTLHVCGSGDVPLFESEVGTVVKYTCVVEGCAVVELVEGDDVVVGVFKDQMANEPACTRCGSAIAASQDIESHGVRNPQEKLGNVRT